MNGPLRRMARQITDSTIQRVHPMTRLPFAPAPEPAPSTLTDTPLPEPYPTQPNEHSTESQPQPSRSPAPDREPAPQRRADEADAVSTAAPATPGLSTQPNQEIAATEPETAPNSTVPRTRIDASASPASAPPEPAFESLLRPAQTTSHSHTATSERARHPARNDSAPPLVASPCSPGELQATRWPAPASAETLPAPLIPEHLSAPGETTPPRTPGSQAQGKGHSTTPEPTAEPDEIHIHIGRIEVTAMQDIPAPRPRHRQKGQQPMSLDDYLARRESSR